jgi:hypothetical protein
MSHAGALHPSGSLVACPTCSSAYYCTCGVWLGVSWHFEVQTQYVVRRVTLLGLVTPCEQEHQEQQHPPQQQQAALLLLLGLWVVGQSGWSWGKCVAMQQSEMRIG